MIHVLATIELVPGTRDAFLREFNANVPAVLRENGCLEYGPAVDFPTGLPAQIPLRPDVAVIVEKWADLAALQAHLKAPHMMAYRERVKNYVAKVSLQAWQPA